MAWCLGVDNNLPKTSLEKAVNTGSCWLIPEGPMFLWGEIRFEYSQDRTRILNSVTSYQPHGCHPTPPSLRWTTSPPVLDTLLFSSVSYQYWERDEEPLVGEP